MKRIVVAEAARRDLASIAEASRAAWGRQQSQRYMNSLRRVLSRLRRHPQLGAAREELASGLRSVAMGRHVVFYRVMIKDLVVLRVLHDRMDVHRHVNPSAKTPALDIPPKR